MGKYTQRHHKIQRLWQRQTIQGSREAQPTPLESCGEPTDLQWDISSQVSTEWSLACNEPRGKQSQDFQDIHIKRVSGTGQQPMIPRSVDCVSYSLETLVSIFHPTFLVSHLSRSSVSTLTTELYAPEGLAYESEHALTFDLGFGPPIPLDVCPFTPIDNTALRSYQKHEGKDTLVVQESLPIALNLFSLESHAEDLDIWLDKIIDSEYWLPQYVALMIHQEKDSHFSHALSGLISWYMGSEDRLSEQEDQIVRPALKLLITTTLLGLVPEVSDLPASLFDYLCSQSPAQDTPQLSLVAPRLLTRQTKASLYYLQELFLSSIFYDFSYSMQLDADVQNALAFLVAYVLDLVRNAGREFASYSMEFKSAFPVTSRHVSEYEKNAETQLFEKVWARVASGNGRVGGLAERWRNLGTVFFLIPPQLLIGLRCFVEYLSDPLTCTADSSVKGKENESDEHRFACAILDAVL
ncbi:hypothetical protein BGZ57DRAFT_152342 [Hyaloscypha finlandica]|nr:hypothetical protein BGZ57DRAFT_152342 [Hyaloscypha finlandica]